MRDCIARIVDASRGFDPEKEATLSEKEAKSLLDELTSAAIKKAKEGVEFNDALSAEIVAKKLEAKQEGAIQKRNALINIAKDNELKVKIDDYINQGLVPRKALQALLVGVQSNVEKGRFSVDANYKALHGQYLGGLVKDLEARDLLSIVNQKAMQKEIEDELWQYSVKNGKPGISGSNQAKEIAGIIHKYNEALRLRQNRAGAAIDKLDNFTGTQTHDMIKMRKAGYEKWRDAIIQHLDKERTFGDANPEQFLKSTYDALSTGIHLKAQGADEGKLFEFKGPANLAKKISQKRVLHFKSAEDARAYRNEFGNKDFIEGVLSGISHASRNVALMETFGTNPRAMFEKLLGDTQATYRGEPKKIKGLEGSATAIRNFYAEVEGATNIIDHPTLALVGAVHRGIQGLSKLGGATISSLSDIPAKAVELQNQGFNILESYGISFRDIFASIGKNTERKQLARALGVGLDGITGYIASRFSASDDLPGRMSKMQRLFFKLNGLDWWTDANKAGTGIAMSHRLAQFKDKNFSSLDKDTQRLFGNYGIREADWDKIRQSATKMVDGNHYITPDAIHNLPDKLFGKNALAAKELLENKLRTYFSDRVDYATPTPDARERAVLNQGYARGTVAGELLRTLAQFKSFSTVTMTKLYGRALFGKGKADIPQLVQLALMQTVFGYGAMVAKDYLKGREPRDASKAATWTAALLQGGGSGILGDYMLGEYNRFGQELTTTLVGPTFGMYNDIARVYSAAKNGDDPSAKALDVMLRNTPFINLAYLRPALNYMFIYQLQEHLNPGYLRRMERTVEQQNNQKFIIKPSQFSR